MTEEDEFVKVKKSELEELVDRKVKERVSRTEKTGKQEKSDSKKDDNVSRREFLKKAGLGALGLGALGLSPSSALDVRDHKFDVYTQDSGSVKSLGVDGSGDVDVPNGNLFESGSRVATRNWATSDNIDHSDLTGLNSDDHHSRYTDGEARSAVDGSTVSSLRASSDIRILDGNEFRLYDEGGDYARMDARTGDGDAVIHKYSRLDGSASRWREHWYDGGSYHDAWATSGGFRFDSSIGIGTNPNSGNNGAIFLRDNNDWTGNAGSNQAKIEYHSGQLYLNSGDSDGDIVRFRNSSGNNVVDIEDSGNLNMKDNDIDNVGDLDVNTINGSDADNIDGGVSYSTSVEKEIDAESTFTIYILNHVESLEFDSFSSVEFTVMDFLEEEITSGSEELTLTDKFIAKVEIENTSLNPLPVEMDIEI